MSHGSGVPPAPPPRLELPGTLKALRILLYIQGALGAVGLFALLAALSMMSRAVDTLGASERDLLDSEMEAEVGIAYETFTSLLPLLLLVGTVFVVAYLVCAAKIRNGGRGLMTAMGWVFGLAAVSEVIMIILFPGVAMQGPSDVISIVILMVMILLAFHPSSRAYFTANTPGS
jgi:hypothetical protein